ncbi:MAG: xylulokinase [Acidobacteriota bacterium]
MPSPPVFLGLDVSTTATKALVLDETGAQRAVASSPYGLETPRPLWAEQDPEQWWRAAQGSIREALKRAGARAEDVLGVGLTGQMHGLVLLGEADEVLRPAILWNDQRSARECGSIRRRAGGLEALVRITGNDAFPGFTAPKILWVREHEPEIYRRIRRVLLPKDFVRLRLTGAAASDRAGAGGTLLLDLETRDWSGELLQALDIPRRWLPATHEGTAQTGEVSARAASLTGLRAGTPVFAGGGDQAAQAVGVGVVNPGATAALTLGTSGVVFAACDRPVTEPEGRLHAFPHALAERWHVMGVMLSAAGSLRWYRDAVAPEVPFESLMEEAASAPVGCEGLVFSPYLSGERTPHADPDARGAFVGLTLRHGRGHLTRSVLEGVSFGLRDNLALVASAGLQKIEEVRISGGGARSPLWRQMLADVLGVRLVPVESEEGAALGAALLAGAGAGRFESVAAGCERAVRLAEPVEPDVARRAAYDELYREFRRHYPALRELSGGQNAS